jgi:hypothetical protein
LQQSASVEHAVAVSSSSSSATAGVRRRRLRRRTSVCIILFVQLRETLKFNILIFLGGLKSLRGSEGAKLKKLE